MKVKESEILWGVLDSRTEGKFDRSQSQHHMSHEPLYDPRRLFCCCAYRLYFVSEYECMGTYHYETSMENKYLNVIQGRGKEIERRRNKSHVVTNGKRKR